MNALYSYCELEHLIQKKKIYVVISVGVFIVALAVSIVLCFFISDSNATLLQVINIVLCSLGGCTSMFLYFNNILPLKNRQAYVRQIISGNKKSIGCVVIAIGGLITVSKNISAYEITVKTDDEAELLLYWDKEKEIPDIIGKNVSFEIVQNTVFGYEVKN